MKTVISFIMVLPFGKFLLVTRTRRRSRQPVSVFIVFVHLNRKIVGRAFVSLGIGFQNPGVSDVSPA